MPEIYQSVVFGMGFWIDNQGLFMSAPSYATGGGCDMDNAIPVYDWENWGELTEHHHSHLAHIVQMCTLKRDSQQLDHYAGGICKCLNQTELTSNLHRHSLIIFMKSL